MLPKPKQGQNTPNNHHQTKPQLLTESPCSCPAGDHKQSQRTQPQALLAKGLPCPLTQAMVPLFPLQTASPQQVQVPSTFATEQSRQEKHYQQLPLLTTTLHERAALLSEASSDQNAVSRHAGTMRGEAEHKERCWPDGCSTARRGQQQSGRLCQGPPTRQPVPAWADEEQPVCSPSRRDPSQRRGDQACHHPKAVPFVPRASERCPQV